MLIKRMKRKVCTLYRRGLEIKAGLRLALKRSSWSTLKLRISSGTKGSLIPISRPLYLNEVGFTLLVLQYIYYDGTC
jgi:hypothetical protein